MLRMQMHFCNTSKYAAAEEWLSTFDECDDESISDLSSHDGQIHHQHRAECVSRVKTGKKSSKSHAVARASSSHACFPVAVESTTGCRRDSFGDKRMSGDFRSGCRGVSWNRRMKAWLAFWMDGRMRRSKTFSSKVFGFDEAKSAAIEFLKSRKREKGMDISYFPVDYMGYQAHESPVSSCPSTEMPSEESSPPQEIDISNSSLSYHSSAVSYDSSMTYACPSLCSVSTAVVEISCALIR